jgi:hypothetical protein
MKMFVTVKISVKMAMNTTASYVEWGRPILICAIAVLSSAALIQSFYHG